MEFNKLFAALLVAMITAAFAGFIAEQVIHPTQLAENSYPVDTSMLESSAGSTAAAVPETAEPIDDLMATADIALGEKLSKVCAVCHTFDAGGVNKVGPNLAGILGAKHAHKSDFAYSDAMTERHAETWTVDKLNQFLWKPKKAIPGTKMVFAGFKKAEDRAALIKWLETKK